MGGFLERLKSGFRGPTKASPTHSTTPGPAAAHSVPVPTPLIKGESSSSVLEGKNVSGAAVSVDLAGKTVLARDGYKVTIPANSPICLLCSSPTYANPDETDILVLEGTGSDDAKMKEIFRGYTLTQRVTCPSCEGVFCWSCLAASYGQAPFPAGDWRCPRCGGDIPDNPAHGTGAFELLTPSEAGDVSRALLTAREQSHTDPIDAVRQSFVGRQASPHLNYFAVRMARVVSNALARGAITEETLRSTFTAPPPDRARMQEFLTHAQKLVGGILWSSTPKLRDMIRSQLDTIVQSGEEDLASQARHLIATHYQPPQTDDPQYQEFERVLADAERILGSGLPLQPAQRAEIEAGLHRVFIGKFVDLNDRAWALIERLKAL